MFRISFKRRLATTPSKKWQGFAGTNSVPPTLAATGVSNNREITRRRLWDFLPMTKFCIVGWAVPPSMLMGASRLHTASRTQTTPIQCFQDYVTHLDGLTIPLA